MGITFDYTNSGSVVVSMFKYIEDLIETFPDPRNTGRAKNPVTAVLFIVREETKSLDGNQTKVFHTYVAKILYIGKEQDRMWQLLLHSYKLGLSSLMKMTGIS